MSLSASSSWLVGAAASTEVTLSTDVRFRPPWPYQDFCGYEAAGVASRPTPFFRILFAALISLSWVHPHTGQVQYLTVCFDSTLQHVVVHIPAATQRFVDSFCLLFGGIQTEFEPLICSHPPPPFLGHPHDLSDTRKILGTFVRLSIIFSKFHFACKSNKSMYGGRHKIRRS